MHHPSMHYTPPNPAPGTQNSIRNSAEAGADAARRQAAAAAGSQRGTLIGGGGGGSGGTKRKTLLGM